MRSDLLAATSLRREWERARRAHLESSWWPKDEGGAAESVPRETEAGFPWRPVPAEATEAALPQDLFDALENYARRVLEENRRVNLVSRRDPAAQIALNIMDSLPLALVWDLVSRETGYEETRVERETEQPPVPRGTRVENDPPLSNAMQPSVSRGTEGGDARSAPADGRKPVSRGTQGAELDPMKRESADTAPREGRGLVSRGTQNDTASDGAAARGRVHPFLVDAGSGSGVPGVPFHLARRHVPGGAPHVVLAESRSRKADFLERLLRDMDLTACSVFAGRLEDPSLATLLDDTGLTGPGILAARALSGTSRALGWLRGLAGRVDGAVFIKGPGLAAEWQREHSRWSRAGWEPARVLAFRFPERIQYLLHLRT